MVFLLYLLEPEIPHPSLTISFRNVRPLTLSAKNFSFLNRTSSCISGFGVHFPPDVIFLVYSCMGTMNMLIFLLVFFMIFSLLFYADPCFCATEWRSCLTGFLGPTQNFASFYISTAGTCLGIAQRAPGRRGCIDIGVDIKDTSTCHSG